jgi:FkbM family methyltransferase
MRARSGLGENETGSRVDGEEDRHLSRGQLMNYRLFVGSVLYKTLHFVLSSRLFPLTRVVPHGLSCCYDIQRYAGTRDLKILFDVGANVGETAWEMALYFPHAKVFCFEPVSSSYETLRMRYRKMTNVRCVRCALGSSRGTGEMHLYKHSEYNTFTESVAAPQKSIPCGTQLVEIDTVDNFSHDNQISEIDILKMDVQGWELEVLKGAEELILSNKVRHIFAEVGFRDEGHPDINPFAKIDRALAKYGYLFSGFYDLSRYGDRKQFTLFGMALYTNPSWGCE